MHFIVLSVVAAISPMDKTLQLGKLTIHLKQSQEAGAVSCEIRTTVAGEPVRIRAANFETSPAFSGCFTLPGTQNTPGYFMVREMVRDTPHTVLIAENGSVVDVDEMLVRGGRWDLVAAD